MIKLNKILSEIRVRGKNYKKELITWFIENSPYLFQYLIDFINNINNHSDIDDIFLEFDFDNEEEMKQKSKELISLLKPNEIYIWSIVENTYDEIVEFPIGYKFLRIIEDDDGDYILILSNEEY